MNDESHFGSLFIEESINVFGQAKGEMLAKQFLSFALESWQLNVYALQVHKLDFFVPLITYFAQIKQLSDQDAFLLINCMRIAKAKINNKVPLDEKKALFEKSLQERKKEIRQRFSLKKTDKNNKFKKIKY